MFHDFSGEKWKKHRKLITPAFHFTILEHFLQVFDTQTKILIENLKQVSKKNEYVNVYPIMAMYAMDIISGLLISVLFILKLKKYYNIKRTFDLIL